MILVALGTQPHQFTRLLDYVEKLVSSLDIDEDIYIQVGETKNGFSEDFLAKDNIHVEEYFTNFQDLVSQADLLMTHGGVGTIIGSILQDKDVISVPRLGLKGEHINEHQVELVEKLDKDNFIIFANNYPEFEKSYLRYLNNDFARNKYHSNNERFNNKLYNSIKDF